MKQLWAPWRIEYILGTDKEDGCFLCRAFKEREKPESLVVHVEKSSFVVLNRYPYNPGHLMVVPKKHVSELSDLTVDERCELMELLNHSIEVLKKELNPQGFNVGINLGRCAGAGLETHVHIHIVPRWAGDTNFMPVLADVKVIPEHIMATYEKLKKAFGEVSEGGMG